VATTAAYCVSIRRNLHASLAVRWAAVSERPIWLTVIGWLRPIYWATFSPAFRGSSYPYSVGMGDMPSSAPSCLPQRQLSGAYEEGIAGMLTIIKASSWDRR
jgi:hypothetical protein